MSAKTIIVICGAMVAAAVGTSSVWAAKKAKVPEAPLTAAGQQLEARYAEQLKALQAEIGHALPVVVEQKKSALSKAIEARKRATGEANAAQEPLNEVGKAQGLVKHGQWWVGDAKKQIAKAQADLKKATTDAARQAAQRTLQEQQKRYEARQLALKERQAALDKVKAKAAPLAGDALGEKRTYGFHENLSGIWNTVALYRQRAIIEEAKAVALAAVGTDIGEANESKVKDVIEKVVVADADKQIVIGQDGTIAAPAVACTSPTSSTEKIVFMKSHLGGMQLHYNRLAKPETFEYAVDAPQAGKYALSARVVTVSPDQHLLVAANDAKEPVDIALPYTIGMWEQTQPAEIALAKGKNVLRFSRNEPVKGLTIKEFTLTPVK